MNSDIKQKWVEALRSGKYPQGQGALSRDGKYCCLGVLCELAVKAGVAERVSVDRETGVLYGDNLEQSDWSKPPRRSDAVLPEVVRVWADLPSNNPGVASVSGGEGPSLSDLNDNMGASFQTIADVIEEGL